MLTYASQCTLMSQIYGEEVFQTGLSPSFTSSFFAQQQRETIPACVIQPSSSHQVSEALQILSRHNCHFAIKSGGHGMYNQLHMFDEIWGLE